MTRMAEDLFSKFSTVEHIDRAFWADPYPVFKRAREESPVYYSETFDAWFLTRYADVTAALRDPRLSSRRAGFKFQGLPEDLREAMKPFERSMGQWMIFNDPPEHTRLRDPVNKAFSTRAVEALRPSVQRIVNELCDAVEGRGEMDVMHDFASPLPGIVVADMLGVTGEDRHRFERWSDDIALFAGASQATRELAEPALRSWREMTACVKEVADARRKSPRDDLLTALLAPDGKGAVLTEEELLSTCVVLLAAGHGATQDTVCNGLLTLLRHPDAKQAVLDDPTLLGTTGMDELVRYESALQLASRIALEDLTISGVPIKKGQRVMGLLGAANRDPAQFQDPDRLDLRRAENRHLAFGYGAHFCIGGPLGKLEGEIAIQTLLRRFPKMRVTTDRLDWKTSVSFRGVRSLPVTF
jgi:cytochrome P450